MRIATPHAALTAALLLAALLVGPPARAQFYRANLSGLSEVPANNTAAFGASILHLNGNRVTLTGAFHGLTGPYYLSHIHECPSPTTNGPIRFNLNPVLDPDGRGGRWTEANTTTFSNALVTALQTGRLYNNVHWNEAALGTRGTVVPAVVIHELRVDQTGADNDEYFELAGPAGTSLDGLTYVVLTGSGTVEYAQSLNGQSIPADGYFLAGGGDDGDNTVLGVTVDLQLDPAFSNGVGVTHLLLAGFTGSAGDDLDANDDGTLDARPWATTFDALGLSDDTPGDVVHAVAIGFVDLPADGTAPFGYAYRDATKGVWRGGQFEPAGGQDTPGTANVLLVADEPAPVGTELSLTVDGNPSHHHAGVRFTLPEAATVRLVLYDVTGREMAVLAEGSWPAGEGSAVIDASEFAAGAYIVRLTAGGDSV
ncbi:MAG TPA: CHRD domain-containing protein, partial [Rubricoccaceae bacterium]